MAMITFSMLGGFGRFGNQLFQMAAAIGHARRVGTRAVFPQVTFSEYLASPPATGQIAYTQVFQEPHFHYANIPLVDGLDLRGYFQSERYFEHCRDEIRSAFGIKEHHRQRLLSRWSMVTDPNSVSIHVRRGDYVSLKDHHPPVTMEYIKNGLSHFKDPKPVVFSDDLQWCIDNFPGAPIFVYGNNPVEDMFLMSQCRGHIIANSSFSWWGAWLDPRGDKTVIAPRQWFGPAYGHALVDLFPSGWRLL
jgi:hypothetical protein